MYDIREHFFALRYVHYALSVIVISSLHILYGKFNCIQYISHSQCSFMDMFHNLFYTHLLSTGVLLHPVLWNPLSKAVRGGRKEGWCGGWME